MKTIKELLTKYQLSCFNFRLHKRISIGPLYDTEEEANVARDNMEETKEETAFWVHKVLLYDPYYPYSKGFFDK